jgi:hypothetical protein
MTLLILVAVTIFLFGMAADEPADHERSPR